MAAKVQFTNNLSLLQTLHLSSLSEIEPDSDGEVEITIESPPKNKSKEEKLPLIGKGSHSSEDDRKYVIFLFL